MIGIIAAMDEEIAILLKHMENKQEQTIAGCLFIEGYLHGKKVVLLKSGIGKVNAAMATTILHEHYTPTHVINTGSAGGFGEKLQVGDIVVSSYVVHHDVDVTAFDYAYGQVPGLPEMFPADATLIKLANKGMKEIGLHAVEGLVATGDAFMQDDSRVEFVRKQFPTLVAAEMEAAAVAQVCYQYQTPFIVIRALSDIAGKESSISFDTFLDQAAKNASTLVMEMIRDMDTPAKS